MADEITYGVFWKNRHGIKPNEWVGFSSWYQTYSNAYECYLEVKSTPNCTDCKIVERVETYTDILITEQ